MKPRAILLTAGVLASGALAMLGDRTPSAAIAEAVERPARQAPEKAPEPAATSPQKQEDAPIPALQERAPLADAADDPRFAGNGALFTSQRWMPAPVDAGPPPAPAAPPPPSAPPLPFTYLGKASNNGAWDVFLARGDKTYIVHEQSLLDGIYRVEAIAPPLLTLTYLPLNLPQQLMIGAPE
jgi:hypothetical protein